MCTFEDGDWYTEDDSKMGTLVKCDHVIPDGYGNLLLIAIAEREGELRSLKKKLFLVSEAKKTKSLQNGGD